MKTEHAIDWTKSPVTIQADYEAKCLEIERLRAELEAAKAVTYDDAKLNAAHALNALLKEQLAAANAEIERLKSQTWGY